MIPPSLTLSVSGVTIKRSISKLFFAGIAPEALVDGNVPFGVPFGVPFESTIVLIDREKSDVNAKKGM